MNEKKREILEKKEIETATLLKELVGHKVTAVEEFNFGPFDSGFKITFDHGKILTAQDGEYGDNAFSFVEKRLLTHVNPECRDPRRCKTHGEKGPVTYYTEEEYLQVKNRKDA